MNLISHRCPSTLAPRRILSQWRPPPSSSLFLFFVLVVSVHPSRLLLDLFLHLKSCHLSRVSEASLRRHKQVAQRSNTHANKLPTPSAPATEYHRRGRGFCVCQRLRFINNNSNNHRSDQPVFNRAGRSRVWGREWGGGGEVGSGVAVDRESDEEENVSGGKKKIGSHRCRRSHPLHKYYTGQSSELTAEDWFFFFRGRRKSFWRSEFITECVQYFWEHLYLMKPHWRLRLF